MKCFDGLLFVETFDCNVAFIDIIVQPLTGCQLFVSLSSITLKNVLFCLMKNPISDQYKKCSFKTTLHLNPSFERMQLLVFKVYSENIHSFIQQTYENCCRWHYEALNLKCELLSNLLSEVLVTIGFAANVTRCFLFRKSIFSVHCCISVIVTNRWCRGSSG